jgi:hypothetical protein
VAHPLGCPRPRIAAEAVSATTLGRRRDEWIDAGIMERCHAIVLAADDRMIGLDLSDVAVDGCITTAPGGGERAGRNSVDRGKQGLKRSPLVDARGIALGVIAAPANRHDAPLVDPTLDTLAARRPGPAPMPVHLGSRRRLSSDTRAIGVPGTACGDCRAGHASTGHGGATLGRGAHQRLDHCAHEAGLVHRAPGRRCGMLARLLGRDHHGASARAGRLEALSLGLPTSAHPMKTSLLAQALSQELIGDVGENKSIVMVY